MGKYNLFCHKLYSISNKDKSTTKTHILYITLHYTTGNYYQWNAATAGTGGTITSSNASGSVCPKGWKLPNASSAFDNTKGSFYYVLSQYGVQSKVNVAAGAVNSPVNSNSYDIALSPLFFVRGGRIDRSNVANKFINAGQGGEYWSSRAYSAASFAYNLRFGSSDVYPSDDYNFNRYIGRSLRCLISTP